MENKGKATRSKRLPQPFVSVTGVKIEEKYCRKCRQMKGAKEFPTAIDIFLDTDGLMSVCSECIDEIYKKFYASENSLERAMLKLCRLLNVAYLDEAIEALKKHIVAKEEKGIGYRPFSLYLNCLVSTQHEEIGHRVKLYEGDFTFKEPSVRIVTDPIDDLPEADELTERWGEGLNYDEYRFLEKELALWERSYTISTRSDEVLIKELCLKQLDLRKARLEGKSVDSILKSFDTLLKTANLAPAQQNAASSGKIADTLGTWIRRVESESPAEYYENKELFKDYDNLGVYCLNYIQRPVLNFLSGNKNFELIESEDEIVLDDYSESDESEGE